MHTVFHGDFMRWSNLEASRYGDKLLFCLINGGVIRVDWVQQVDWRMGCLMVRSEDTGRLLVPGFDGYLLGPATKPSMSHDEHQTDKQ
jgi:hypothetical protein